MPKVGKTSYPYTKAGVKEAKEEAKEKGMPMHMSHMKDMKGMPIPMRKLSGAKPKRKK